jgi:hypothetical protein
MGQAEEYYKSKTIKCQVHHQDIHFPFLEQEVEGEKNRGKNNHLVAEEMTH